MPLESSSTSNFKRFFLRLFLPVLSGVAVLLFLIGTVFEKKIILASETSGAYKINRIISSTDENEIPIFGSSRAEGSFIPDILGPNYFNYGMSGTQDDVALTLLARECRKKKESSLVLINFDLEGIDSSVGNLANYLYNIREKDIQQLLENKFRIYHLFPVVKYYGHFENYLKHFLNSKIQLTKYVNKGAYVETNVLPASKFNALVQQRLKSRAKFRNEKDLTSNFIHLMSENQNKTFVFVVAPYHSSYLKNFVNLKDAEKFLTSLDTLPNVEVINFSKVNYPDSLFLNTTHLNYIGAVKFSSSLKDSLSMKFRNKILD